jgi:uncharacterized membrane protein HdeD (DUF308 family)
MPDNAQTMSPVGAGAGWGWILAYGIVSVVLGLLAFGWPFSATLTATFVMGAFFIAAGAISLIAGASGRGHEGRGYSILFGIVSVVIGLLMVLDPISGALSLTLVVAIWLAMRGILELVLGARFRRHRGMMLAMGLINILLAAYVLATLPWSALTLPGFVLGMSFIFGGVTAVLSALAHKQGAPAFAIPA